MTLPSATLTIQDGSLGISPAASGNISVVQGVVSKGTPATVYGPYRDITDLVADCGYGPAVEALALQLVRGGTGYLVPTTTTYDGASSAVTQVGTGAGTIATPTFAPLQQIVVTCTTTGALGVAAFTFKLGTAAASAPVVSAAGWSSGYAPVGAPLTRISFVAGGGPTYFEAGDVWTISTTEAEASNVSVVRTGASTGHLQQASEPVDDYTCQVEIRSTGLAGAGTFRYTLDNFTDESGASLATWSSDLLIPSGKRYQMPNTGVVLVFDTGSYTDGDTYSFNTVASGTNTTHVSSAFTALRASSGVSYGFGHVAATPATSAGAATLAATLDTEMSTNETAHDYNYWICDVPTSGTRVLSGGLATASAESDSTVATAFASTTSKRVVYGAGDFLAVSGVNRRLCRRPASWQAAMESAARPIHENLHRVRTGALSSVRRNYVSDSQATTLDNARFLTLRKFKGKIGSFIAFGRTGAESTSDFSRVPHRRVMDRACTVVYAEALDLIGETVPVNDDGTIQEKSAAAIEADINAALENAIVANGHASASYVTVNRSWNVLSTSIVKITVRVTPFGSADFIEVTIGYTNPNQAAA